MTQPATFLMLEFLSWIARQTRTYADAMEAWRSSCPRHTVWEDAIAAGFIQLGEARTLNDSPVTLTQRGRAVLEGPPHDTSQAHRGAASRAGVQPPRSLRTQMAMNKAGFSAVQIESTHVPRHSRKGLENLP